MSKLIESPTEIEAAGNIPKIIKEFVGSMNTSTDKVSIALMSSPEGWSEPGQTPQFDEYSIILKGCLQIETKEKTFQVQAGQAFHAQKGEWVRYSSPAGGGAEYVAICVPAFSPDLVHRDPH